MAIENTMVNAQGEPVSLKPGAEVDVVIEAAVEAAVEDTIKKSDPPWPCAAPSLPGVSRRTGEHTR
jgi:hypothetical protein